jgi:hypothetical protein
MDFSLAAIMKQRGICVRVGMEATGYSRWFDRLLAELGFELWIGDPAEKFCPHRAGIGPLPKSSSQREELPLLRQ